MENVFLTSLTTPEVRQLFRDELEKYFASHKQNESSQQNPDQLLTIKQAADFLTLSAPTLYGLVSRAAIPVSKRGKRLYFSKQELTDWIKAGRKLTVSEIETLADEHLAQQNKKR